MVVNYHNPADEEACGDARPSLQRLRREGRNQREELHRLQGEGGQDTDHPGLEERKKRNHDPPPPAQMGPGMVQQSQAVCGECDGRGEIIPPSSRLTLLHFYIVVQYHHGHHQHRCHRCCCHHQSRGEIIPPSSSSTSLSSSKM